MQSCFCVISHGKSWKVTQKLYPRKNTDVPGFSTKVLIKNKCFVFFNLPAHTGFAMESFLQWQLYVQYYLRGTSQIFLPPIINIIIIIRPIK